MGELRFFMTRKDTEEFLDFLVSEFSPSFIPSWSYEPIFPVFRTTIEVLNYIDAAPHRLSFHVQSKLWTQYPLSTSYIVPKGGSKPYYSLDQRYGGPTFDFQVSAEGVKRGCSYCIGGRFSDYPSYYLQKGLSDSFKRPEAMTAAFISVGKYMRRKGRRSRKSDNPKWPGGYALTDARKQFQQGLWLRMGDHQFVPDQTRS